MLDRIAPRRAPAMSISPTGTEWPFRVVSHKRSRAGSKTCGADVITWLGQLNGRIISFTTRPRNCNPHASFYVPSNARIAYTTTHPQYVDLHVHGVLDEGDRELLRQLAQVWDTRPVVVRCHNELVRGTVTPNPSREQDQPGQLLPLLPLDGKDSRET
jgi:hypothetical protein